MPTLAAYFRAHPIHVATVGAAFAQHPTGVLKKKGEATFGADFRHRAIAVPALRAALSLVHDAHVSYVSSSVRLTVDVPKAAVLRATSLPVPAASSTSVIGRLPTA